MKSHIDDNNIPYGCLGILVLAIFIFICYLIYQYSIEVFVFFGFNIFFFLDNLLYISVFNPIIVWGIIGFLLGSIIGVSIAVKKLGLNKNLVWYIISFNILTFMILGFLNEPLYHDVKSISKNIPINEVTTIPIEVYELVKNSNLYSEPTKKSKKSNQIKKGETVEVLQKNIIDNKSIKWFKILYKQNEYFIEANNLKYSHTKHQVKK